MQHISRLFHEIRIMSTKLPGWRFAVLALIAALFALGYLVGNLHWIRWW